MRIQEKVKAKYQVKEQPKEESVPSVPVKMKEPSPPPHQPTARELLEASYEIRRAKREEQIQKIDGFKSKML